jgi:acyl carrier protein
MTDEATMPSIVDVERRIVEFLQRELLPPDVTVERDDDLLSGDLLDSIGVLRLATFVDQEFAIGMQPSDFVIENFQTVAVLARYVERASSSVVPDRAG